MSEFLFNGQRVTIDNAGTLAALGSRVDQAEGELADALRGLAQCRSAQAIARAVKFEQRAAHPVTLEPRTIAEAVNMIATVRATIAALHWLSSPFPGTVWELALCENGGSDIASSNGHVAAEVYAARQYNANRKLTKCRSTLVSHPAAEKFVFLDCPNRPAGRQHTLERAADRITIVNVADKI